MNKLFPPTAAPAAPAAPVAPAAIQTKNTEAVAKELCKKIYDALSPFGFYPALTGGCLYKEGNRKDIDIVIYRNRQKSPSFEMSDLEGMLKKAGLGEFCFFGFVAKAKYREFNVDIFNPETNAGDTYEQEATGD